MLSKYTCVKWWRCPVKTSLVIVFWKQLGAFFRPNGNTLKWYVAPSGVEKAVYFFESGSIGICQ